MNGLVLLFSAIFLLILIAAFVILDKYLFKKLYNASLDFDDAGGRCCLNRTKGIVVCIVCFILTTFLIYRSEVFLKNLTAQQIYEYVTGFFFVLLVVSVIRLFMHIVVYYLFVRGAHVSVKMTKSLYRLREDVLTLPLAFSVGLVAAWYEQACFLIGMSFGLGLALLVLVMQILFKN